MSQFFSVNAWIIGAPGQQAIVDSGMPDAATAALWAQAEAAGEVAGVEAVVGTHMHRDHTGQSAALMQRHGAPLYMTAQEHAHLVAQSAASTAQRRERLWGFLHRLGLEAAAVQAIEPIDYTMLDPFPQNFVPLTDGMELRLGGMDWQVLLGGGHSSEAAVLIAADQSLMLAGDQILPGSGPHITAGPAEQDADLLSEYFAFLDRLSALPDTMLVLPGHGAPFSGIARHAVALRQGHDKRLARLLAGFSGSLSCFEMTPLVFSARTVGRFGDLLPGMTLALANHLWQVGQLRRHLDDDGVFRFERR